MEKASTGADPEAFDVLMEVKSSSCQASTSFAWRIRIEIPWRGLGCSSEILLSILPGTSIFSATVLRGHIHNLPTWPDNSRPHIMYLWGARHRLRVRSAGGAWSGPFSVLKDTEGTGFGAQGAFANGPE
eukprot:1159841-Pelagomonas_calceolata.AAC.5